MARLNLLPVQKDGEPLDTWVRRVALRKRGLQLFGVVLFLGVMTIEFQQQFNANPMYLFLLVFGVILVWVASDYMTSKVEAMQSDAEWDMIEERDNLKARKKVED